jgi:hypothetical protein
VTASVVANDLRDRGLRHDHFAGGEVKNGLFDVIHVTGDRKRMYVTNSLLSTLDHSGRFYVRLVHIGPDGMKVDPFFNIDLNKL